MVLECGVEVGRQDAHAYEAPVGEGEGREVTAFFVGAYSEEAVDTIDYVCCIGQSVDKLSNVWRNDIVL